MVPNSEAKVLLEKHPEYAKVLKPFLIGDEMISNLKSQPKRFVIDFTNQNLIEASQYKLLFQKLEQNVLPDIQKKADDERAGITKPNGREAQLRMWWKMWRRREDMLKETYKRTRYISCARVTKRPIFQFISSEIRPNDALMVFAFDDDYSFGIINSKYHWEWFREKCSTLKGDWRYTTDSVWDTFPWPQSPSAIQIEEVAKASKALRDGRNQIMAENKMSLRDIYRLMEKPGKNPVRDLQNALDRAVTEAYGFDERADLLEQLLNLNHQIACREQKGEPVIAPGLPDWFKNKEKLISDDCVRFEG